MAIQVQVAEELHTEGNVTFASSRNLLLGVGLLAVLLAVWFGVVISRSITVPLAIMSGALQNLQMGNLNRDMPQSVKDSIMNRGDEFGTGGKGLGNTEIYLLEMAEIAQKIAIGDLTVNVSPRSDKDELGNAFAKMIAGLRETVGSVAESASSLGAASEQLASAANQAARQLRRSPRPFNRSPRERANNPSPSTARPPPSNR